MAILELTDIEYRKLEGVNASTLKHFINSVKEGNKALEKPFKGSEATRFGTLCHSYILEYEKFTDEYILFVPPVNEKTGEEFGKATKAYKSAYELVESSGKTPYTKDDLIKLDAIKDSIDNDKDATKVLGKSDKRELVLTWVDKETGLNCKAKLDFIGDKIAGDLKTIGDFKFHGYSEDDEILRNKKLHYQCLDYGYYLQFAHYFNGCIANDFDLKYFAVIWCERDGINDVCTNLLSDDKLELGQEQLRQAFSNYQKRDSEETNYHKMSFL